MPGGGSAGGSFANATGALPQMLREPFARAMGESLYLPAAMLLIGIIAALCFERPTHAGMRAR